MRPLRLTMSAFGPYGGQVVLNMEMLGKRGLYLVTGDTGTGKTTIFDAICYALYGEASGSSRHASMLRSNFAEPQTPTFVELEFACGGKNYLVRRSPAYERPSERKGKLVSQAAAATLIYPDGRQPVTGLKQVTAAVTDLIGLDRDQFSQIAMIAQGDFLRLLQAKTENRIEIFQKIFHTGAYDEFQKRAKRESAELRGEYEKLELAMEQNVRGIQIPDDLEVEAALEEVLPEEADALLSRCLVFDQNRWERLVELLQEQDEALQTLNQQIGLGELTERTRLQLADTMQRQAEAEKQKEALQAQLSAREEWRLQVQQKHLQAETLQQSLLQYDELADLEQQKKTQELRSQELVRQERKTAEEAARSEKAVTDIQAENPALLEMTQRYAELKADIREQEIRQTDLQTLAAQAQRVSQAQSALENARKTYLSVREESEKLSASYHQMERLFLDHQAGILAQTLEAGCACPVCGSVDHPNPAKCADHAPDQAALEKARKLKESADRRKGQASEEASRYMGEAATAEEAFSQLKSKILGTDEKRPLAELQTACRQRMTELTTELREAKSKQQELSERQKMLPKLQASLEHAKQEHLRITQEITACGAKKAALDEEILRLRQRLTYENRQEALAVIRGLNQEADRLKQQLQQAEEAYSAAEKNCDALETQKKTLQEKLQELPELDLEALRRKQRLHEQTREEVLRQREKTAHRLTTNCRIRDQFQNDAEQLHLLGQKWIMVKNLSDTVNGTLSGKEKVMLETYVQMTFFDRILQRANVRLLEMTGGRYTLQRQVAAGQRSQTGLELDVLDHGTGMARSVCSLSGGESFQASLCLALGMSDELLPVGGVRLDTLFVDEGFGSLDEESLRQAMQTLQSLSEGDRLVGIISHVELLKQWVDRQIRVTRLPDGQSAVTLCAEA